MDHTICRPPSSDHYEAVLEAVSDCLTQGPKTGQVTGPLEADPEYQLMVEANNLAAEIENLTTLARTRKIALEDLKGGTISITSAGSIGGILATPILNYPEVAILGVYRIKDRPVVRDGEIVIRKMTNLSITLDHRIVDGATAARFLNEVIRLLESPGLMLLEDA